MTVDAATLQSTSPALITPQNLFASNGSGQSIYSQASSSVGNEQQAVPGTTTAGNFNTGLSLANNVNKLVGGNGLGNGSSIAGQTATNAQAADSLGTGSSLAQGTDAADLASSTAVDAGANAANTGTFAAGYSESDLAGIGSAVGTGATSLGSVLGAGGFGALAGGLISKLTGGNTVGSTIGGAVGGIAGSLLLGGLTTGIGTEVGATVGSIIPGIGTVIGAVGGALLGGLFGGGVHHPASGYSGGTLAADGALAGGHVGADNASTSVGEGLQDSFQSYMQSQATKYGITYGSGINVAVGYDPGSYGGAGSRVYLQDSATGQSYNYNFDINDPDSMNAAYQQAFTQAATISGIDPTSLVAVQPTKASEVTISKNPNAQPTAFDTFLANYRKQNGQS